MRTITKGLLGLNLLVLLFIVLWLLVGGANRSYFGGGAASEVDGILLLILAGFNVIYFVTAFFVLPHPPGRLDAAAAEVLDEEAVQTRQRLRGMMRSWSGWALTINGILFLFVGVWLLVSSDRFRYFQANATQVDLVLLFALSLLNVAYMGLALLVFSRAPRKPAAPVSESKTV